MTPTYIDTVQLLLDIAPAVFESPYFAMKGGTALNLFVQDMPRLSVDIDVVFTDHTLPRDKALATIGQELAAAKARVEQLRYVAEVRQNKNGDEAKMFVTSERAQVKVEVNFVFRGTVLPVVHRSLTPATQELFSTNVTLPLLDTPELYGSKLVAALDRQHPRDLFDVQNMVEMFGGLPEVFVDCFVAYLAGHNRPVHEVLFTTKQPLQAAFENEFDGMTSHPVTLASLEATRDWLFHQLPRSLTANHRQFLLSLVRAEPNWNLMPFPHLQELPGIRWKLMNLEKLQSKRPEAFALQHDELASRFASLGPTPQATLDDPVVL